MHERTCSIDGCDKPHRGRGFCSGHYKAARRAEDPTYNRYLIACSQCGKDFHSARRDGKFCSDECKGGAYRRHSKLPPDHPVMVLIAAARKPRPRPAKFTPEVRECAWCGCDFLARIDAQIFCSAEHKIKAKKNRRRGRAHGSTSHYTWAEFMRLFIALDKRCAYCEQRVIGQPDPDHVVPLSKGGSNSITNILPACRPCNSDKRDLMLDEWNTDRARRHLSPRTTSNPAWTHLTSVARAA